MSDKLKLHYFDSKGLGEVVRLMFTCAGVEFEDNRYNETTWKEAKPKMPMHVMPVLEMKDGKMFGQSNAIYRYVAREHDMYGASNLDALKIDEICETMNDLFKEVIPIYMEKDEEKKAELITKAVAENMPKMMAFLERRLSENGEGNGWFVGDNISLADFMFYNGTNLMAGVVKEEKFSPLLEDKEKLRALKGRIEAHPKLAEYILKSQQ